MTRTRQTEGGDDPRYGWAIVAATTARAVAPFGAAALALLPGGYDTALATLVMLTGAAAAAAWQAHRTGSQPLPLSAPAVEGATS